jgi:hypothetical protein
LWIPRRTGGGFRAVATPDKRTTPKLIAWQDSDLLACSYVRGWLQRAIGGGCLKLTWKYYHNFFV